MKSVHCVSKLVSEYSEYFAASVRVFYSFASITSLLFSHFHCSVVLIGTDYSPALFTVLMPGISKIQLFDQHYKPS